MGSLKIYISSVRCVSRFQLTRAAGGVGEGSKMKCINNHLAGVHLCAAAEAMAFAQRKGMDLQKAYEVLSKGAAASYVLVDREFLPGRPADS